MPRPDLPTELWLHILSYLPARTARKLIGVSYSLFQLALDDLYSEFDISLDNEVSRYRLNQLLNRDLSRRLRHLLIKPVIIPPDELTRKGTTSLQDWFLNKITNVGSMPKHRIADQFASNILAQCLNMRHITICLPGFDTDKDIVSLLPIVVQTVARNCRLKTLTIESAVSHLPTLLQPFIQNPRSLSNLHTLEITLSGAFKKTGRSYLSLLSPLTFVLLNTMRTLKSFSLRSALEIDLDKYFATLPCLPSIRVLKLYVGSQSFPTIDGLFLLLQNHARQLECLEIMPPVIPLSMRPGGNSEADMQSPSVFYDFFFLKSSKQPPLSQLHFPDLVSFRVTTPHSVIGRHTNPLPSLPSLMPKLTTFALDMGYKFSSTGMKRLIDGLPLQNGVVGLRTLEVSCQTFSPEILDMLALRLPNLRSLTLNYVLLSVTRTTDPPFQPVPKTPWLDFVMAMKTRQYVGWHIGELRIARLDPDFQCYVPHPALPVMAAISRSLPLGRQVYLDRDFKCQCVPK